MLAIGCLLARPLALVPGSVQHVLGPEYRGCWVYGSLQSGRPVLHLSASMCPAYGGKGPHHLFVSILHPFLGPVSSTRESRATLLEQQPEVSSSPSSFERISQLGAMVACSGCGARGGCARSPSARYPRPHTGAAYAMEGTNRILYPHGYMRQIRASVASAPDTPGRGSVVYWIAPCAWGGMRIL